MFEVKAQECPPLNVNYYCGVTDTNCQCVLFKKVVLDSAQICKLNSASPLLIAAPGAGKNIVILQAYGVYSYSNNPYTCPDTISIRMGSYQNLGFTYVEYFSDPTGSITQVQDIPFTFQPTGTQAIGSVSFSNQGVYLWTPNTDPSGGHGTLTIYLAYLITNL